MHAQQRRHADSLCTRRTLSLVASNESVLLDVGDAPMPVDMPVCLQAALADAMLPPVSIRSHGRKHKMQLSLSAAVVLWVKQKATGLHYGTAFIAPT